MTQIISRRDQDNEEGNQLRNEEDRKFFEQNQISDSIDPLYSLVDLRQEIESRILIQLRIGPIM